MGHKCNLPNSDICGIILTILTIGGVKVSSKGKRKRKRATITLKVDGVDYGVANQLLCAARSAALNKDIDTLFNVRLNGYEFDGLPFLITGSDWWKSEYRDALSHEALKYSEHVPNIDLEDLYIDEEQKCVNQTLISSPFIGGASLVAAFLCKVDIRAFVRIAMMEAGVCIQSVLINNTMEHIDYRCPGVHNSQAFSYYILLAWIVTVYPPLGVYLSRQLRSSRYNDIMASFAPDGSCLNRYLKGDISAAAFKAEYFMPRYLDGTSLRDREMLCLLTEGEYEGQDMDKVLKAVLVTGRCLMDGNLIVRFGLQLGRYFSRSRTRWDLDSKVISLQNDIVLLRGKLSEQRKKHLNVLAKKDNRIEQLTDRLKEVDILVAENHKLREAMGKESKLDSIKEELAETQDELRLMTDKYIALKAELRDLRKVARSAQQVGEPFEEEASAPEVVRVSQADMLLNLADTSVLVVGGDNLGISDYLVKQGIKAFQFSRTLKSGFKCDVIMVIANKVSHKDVAAAISWARGTDYEIVYFTGTNKEKCVEALYARMGN